MRTLTLLFSLIVTFPFVLSAQTAGELLQKVSAALSEGQDDYVVSLFRQAIAAGADQTEMYYWTQIEKTVPWLPVWSMSWQPITSVSGIMTKLIFLQRILAVSFRRCSCTCVVCRNGDDERQGKDAVKTYEKVLMLDANNLQANIFLGSYYYLQAEREKKKLEDDYKKITSPTRMQYARYRNGLSDVYSNVYSKAKDYLQRVLQLFPSTEAGNTLEK